METISPSDIAQRLAELRCEHRRLDAEIAVCPANSEDEMQIKRLKKRKLLLKDRIAQLEAALTPDEPA